jgi:hypothetical protein
MARRCAALPGLAALYECPLKDKENEPMTIDTKPARNGFPAIAPGTRLLGEVISWTCPAVTVRHRAVIEALRDATLDETVARELAPRHAFSRACKKLARSGCHF